MGLGSALAIALLANSAQLFGPLNVDPEMPGTVALEAAIPFGQWGLVLALLGMLFAVAGAAVETCMANAYSIAQFFGWRWGRHKKPWEAPRFTLTWIALFVLALLMILAGDKNYMGIHANGPRAKSLGWIYFAIVTVAAVAALPLSILTSGGNG